MRPAKPCAHTLRAELRRGVDCRRRPAAVVHLPGQILAPSAHPTSRWPSSPRAGRNLPEDTPECGIDRTPFLAGKLHVFRSIRAGVQLVLLSFRVRGKSALHGPGPPGAFSTRRRRENVSKG